MPVLCSHCTHFSRADLKHSRGQMKRQPPSTLPKTPLANASLLAYPATDAPTCLMTETSDKAVGAVLQQNINGTWQPVSFFSRKMTPAETRYSTFDSCLPRHQTLPSLPRRPSLPRPHGSQTTNFRSQHPVRSIFTPSSLSPQLHFPIYLKHPTCTWYG